MRSSDELRRSRRALFDGFPYQQSPESVLTYQQLLRDEILKTEGERSRDKTALNRAHLGR